MILNFKSSLAVMIFFCCITAVSRSQGIDTLQKVPTIKEKSETVILRLEKELSLTKDQSTKLMSALLSRFEQLQNPATSLETENQRTLQKLASILDTKQYSLYQELRTKKKQEKDKYLRDHPGFSFSKEDLQMDF
jgi:hypothetical protein